MTVLYKPKNRHWAQTLAENRVLQILSRLLIVGLSLHSLQKKFATNTLQAIIREQLNTILLPIRRYTNMFITTDNCSVRNSSTITGTVIS